jgi:hypothetical protein
MCGEPIIGTPGMSLRRANLLTLSGFCALYFGLMGILMAINVPVSSDARRPAVLVLGAIALAGLVVMSLGRLTKADDRSDGGYPPIRT